MNSFEFVVTSGAPKRVSSAARSHAVKQGLQRKTNLQEPKGSHDSKLTIRQKATLKGRFKISEPATKTKTHGKARLPTPQHPDTLKQFPDISPPDTDKDASKQRVQIAVALDWDPIGSVSIVRSPSSSRGDPFNSFPIEQTDSVEILLQHFVYRPFGQFSGLGIDETWWAFAQSDAVVLHATLGVAAAAWGLMLPNPRDACGEANRQKGLAIKGIQEKLKNEDTSDALLSAVANLANMDGLEGEFESALVHLKGLKDLVEARGGSTNLRNKMHIARCINWSDLQVSAALNTRPLLNLIHDLDTVSLTPKTITVADPSNLAHLEKYETSPDSTTIRHIFSIIRQAQDGQKDKHVSATDVRTLTNVADYDIANTIADGLQTSQGHTILLAARVYTHLVLRQSNPQCRLPTITVKRLRQRIQEHMDAMASNEDYWNGLLWCLCIGACSSSETGDTREWFGHHVCEIVRMANIRQQGHLEGIMETFLWDRGILGGAISKHQSDLFSDDSDHCA